MKVILKEPLYMAKFGVIFPKDVEMSVIVYDNVYLIQHPTREGILTKLPKSKSKYVLLNS